MTETAIPINQPQEQIMSQQREGALKAESVMAQMKQNGVTHVVWLPDSETTWLYKLMSTDPDIKLVTMSREGLAFSAAAGLILGGKTPLLLIQNTGLMESGDSMRGWGIDLNMPIVVLVGYRGWTRRGTTYDTAAIYTERFLNAFSINYYLVESDADAPRISLAFEDARKTNRPVAVLIGDEYIAGNFGFQR
jgi:sulfopyruvate decarboxylase TPP-binding subunit